MNKRKKKYSVRKILTAVILFALFIYLIILALNSMVRGKTEDKVPVPVLTKDEMSALRLYNNDYHLEVARKKGLEKPLVSQAELEARTSVDKSRNLLVEIVDNKYYEIPHLTNSLPYLHPHAKQFLNLLGKRFCDRLEESGLRKYRFSVTSILRTVEDQKTLRKNNVNATPNNSSHYYGRTFDIAQTRFFERGNSSPVYSYRLRNILLRELIEMQNEGKCYVLLEEQTKCIHVTVR